MVFCPQCGNALAEGAAFCSACGRPAAGPPAPVPPAAPPAPPAYAHPGTMAPAWAPPAPAPQERPVGVTILGVLAYIAAAMCAFAAVMVFFGALAFGAFFGGIFGMPQMASMGAVFAFMFALVVLAVGAAAAATGWGLMNARPWGWVLALVLTVLNGVGNLFELGGRDMAGSLVGLLIAAGIVYYLLRPEVRAYFGQK